MGQSDPLDPPEWKDLARKEAAVFRRVLVYALECRRTAELPMVVRAMEEAFEAYDLPEGHRYAVRSTVVQAYCAGGADPTVEFVPIAAHPRLVYSSGE